MAMGNLRICILVGYWLPFLLPPPQLPPKNGVSRHSLKPFGAAVLWGLFLWGTFSFRSLSSKPFSLCWGRLGGDLGVSLVEGLGKDLVSRVTSRDA